MPMHVIAVKLLTLIIVMVLDTKAYDWWGIVAFTIVRDANDIKTMLRSCMICPLL
jgi:hypothetical protein